MKPKHRMAVKVVFILAFSYIMGQVTLFFVVNDPVLAPIIAIPGLLLNCAVGWSMGNDLKKMRAARRKKSFNDYVIEKGGKPDENGEYWDETWYV